MLGTGTANDTLVVPGHAGLQNRRYTEIDHARRFRWMKAYFNSALSRSTPSPFPGGRAPSSRAPVPPAAGGSPLGSC
ncbi:hypothetical protein J2W28_004283 [Variovorax boronicumulans]|nr:hypothetical protein [Variovorax boronicumulans]MDQ0005121.1 hypothetical protein [Variovorax boronicumulans]